MKRIFAFFICVFIAMPAFTAVRVTTADDFMQIKQLLSTLPDPEKTLIVFDDDDTLSTMPCSTAITCQYFGTPEWFQWQRSLQDSSPNRVASTFQGLIQVENKIIEQSPMAPTDQGELSVLRQLSDNHFSMMVETARGPELRDATWRELKALGILHYMHKEALSVSGGRPIEFDSPVAFEGSAPVYFDAGILYVSGRDKGVVLHAFLEKTKQTHSYTQVVFIDDDMKNIQHVAQSFEGGPVNALVIYYDKLVARKKTFFESRELQRRSLERFTHSR